MKNEKKLVKFERSNGEFQTTMHVIYYVTGGCKFNCAYCDVVDNKRNNTTFDEQKQIIDTLMQLDKPFEIYLYGGEPTEYVYIHELIQYTLSTRSRHLKRIELQTNLNITTHELNKFLKYDLLVISPSIHITFLKKDTIDDLYEKISLINNADRLERIDFMLEKWKKDEHLELNNRLHDSGLGEKIIYVHNYYEPNKKDIYTGKYNSAHPEYDQILHDNYTSQENYMLTFDDGSTEIRNANQLVVDNMSFEGWLCDAKKNLVWIDFNGDWWECNTAQQKTPPRGNILYDSDKFLRETKYPTVCRIKKCDACFFVKKWQKS